MASTTCTAAISIQPVGPMSPRCLPLVEKSSQGSVMTSRYTHGILVGSRAKKSPRHAVSVTYFQIRWCTAMISALHFGLKSLVLKVPMAPTMPPTPTKPELKAGVSSRSHRRTCSTVPYSLSESSCSLAEVLAPTGALTNLALMRSSCCDAPI